MTLKNAEGNDELNLVPKICSNGVNLLNVITEIVLLPQFIIFQLIIVQKVCNGFRSETIIINNFVTSETNIIFEAAEAVAKLA